YGRALMLKAGFKGSAINDIVWMGDVVNEASNLCAQGNRDFNAPLQVSAVAYGNMKEDYQKMLTRVLYDNRYQGFVVNTGMNEWLSEKKERERRAAQQYALRGLFGGQYNPPYGGLYRLGMLRQPPAPRPESLALALQKLGLGKPSGLYAATAEDP